MLRFYSCRRNINIPKKLRDGGDSSKLLLPSESIAYFSSASGANLIGNSIKHDEIIVNSRINLSELS